MSDIFEDICRKLYDVLVRELVSELDMGLYRELFRELNGELDMGLSVELKGICSALKELTT